jgi:hypothetical protein
MPKFQIILPRKIRNWIWGIFPILIFGVYRGILSVFFVQDDFWFLEAAQKPWPFKTMFLGVLPDYWRPLSTYWITLFNLKLWGLNPFGHHLTFLIIFSVTAIVLNQFLMKITH